MNGNVFTTPYTKSVIQGSLNGVAAATPQTLGGSTYDFGSWSDGGARVHSLTANGNQSLTATFTKR